VFESGMIGVVNHLGAQEIRPKFLNGKANRAQGAPSRWLCIFVGPHQVSC